MDRGFCDGDMQPAQEPGVGDLRGALGGADADIDGDALPGDLLVALGVSNPPGSEIFSMTSGACGQLVTRRCARG
ncbi:MAG: hypothetical protein ACRDP7_47100 [Trebonia sp.]